MCLLLVVLSLKCNESFQCHEASNVIDLGLDELKDTAFPLLRSVFTGLNIKVDSVIGFPTQQEGGFPFGCVDLQRENKINGFLFCNVKYKAVIAHCATFATNVIQREKVPR